DYRAHLDLHSFPTRRSSDLNATGIIDPITGLLDEGYAVLERDIYGTPKVEAYFEPFKTTIITDGNAVEYPHTAPAPLLVPIIHRSEEHTSELQSRFDLVCRL